MHVTMTINVSRLTHFRYENTVVGQFFGHAHTSFYEVFYDDVNFTRPISVMHIPGSITTYTSNNPGYRIYEMDGNYTGSSWVCSSWCHLIIKMIRKVQVGKDQEKAQSERYSHSKNRGGKKPN